MNTIYHSLGQHPSSVPTAVMQCDEMRCDEMRCGIMAERPGIIQVAGHRVSWHFDDRTSATASVSFASFISSPGPGSSSSAAPVWGSCRVPRPASCSGAPCGGGRKGDRSLWLHFLTLVVYASACRKAQGQRNGKRHRIYIKPVSPLAGAFQHHDRSRGGRAEAGDTR